MGSKEQLTDMVVVVPGILGSVLKYGGENVWNPGSPGFLGGRAFGVPLDRLRYSSDEPAGSIKATGLIKIPFGLRNLLGCVGYDVQVTQLKDTFQEEDYGGECSNFHEFPYDWRQDNAKSAELLKEFIDKRLQLWRDQTKNDEARVILLAHSMGGLVCRHFLEELDGWRRCRMLATFGTPFRGSLNALRYVFDGYKVGRTDTSAAMLTMPALYQLLPIHAVIRNGVDWIKPWDYPALHEINADNVAIAREFHERLLSRVNANRKLDEYQDEGYFLYPIVGVEQPTMQRLSWNDGKYSFTDEMPDDLSKLPRYGDGTVPHLSAIPVEMSKAPACHYVPERHAFLHANERALEGAIQAILTVQSGQLAKARGAAEKQKPEGIAAYSVELFPDDDLKSIAISVQQRNVSAYGSVEITARSLTDSSMEPITETPAVAEDGMTRCNIKIGTAGCFEIEIRSADGATSPPPVRDIVEVL